MNLRVRAEQDLALILEDLNDGFAQSITFFDSANSPQIVNCWGVDIGTAIDATTGLNVIGRTVQAYARLSSLTSLGIIIKKSSRVLIEGKDFFIKDFMLDKTLGIVALVFSTSRVNNG